MKNKGIIFLTAIVSLGLLMFFAVNPQEIKTKPAVTTAAPLRALYLPLSKGTSLPFVKKIIERGKPLGVNMLVIDVHNPGNGMPRISREVMEYLTSEKILCVARVVCFPDGLNRMPVDEAYMNMLAKLVETAAQFGFQEIQLDYIRFRDGGTPYTLEMKYRFIGDLLARFKTITDTNKVKLSADLFGRIVYNRNDEIGQKVEIFSKYMDVLYPMLYPSHYTGDTARMAKPGETVKEGTLKGLDRVKGTDVKIQPYIQAFGYMVGHARVNLDRYIKLQIDAVESTGARGWVAWNARGDYEPVFKALEMPAAE